MITKLIEYYWFSYGLTTTIDITLLFTIQNLSSQTIVKFVINFGVF